MKTTFGHFLAYCLSQKSMDELTSIFHFSASERREMERFRQQAIEINASGGSATILNMIPTHECHCEHSFLQNNEGFFFALVFDNKNAAEFESRCLRLTRHLNDCYRCFEIFHHTMRDYYFKALELSKMKQ